MNSTTLFPSLFPPFFTKLPKMDLFDQYWNSHPTEYQVRKSPPPQKRKRERLTGSLGSARVCHAAAASKTERVTRLVKNKFPNASFDSPLYPKVVSFNPWFKSMKPSRFVLFSIHTISHLLLVPPAFLFSLSQQTTLFGRPLVTLPITHHHHHPDPFDQEKQTAVDVFALDAWRRRTVETSGTDPRIAQVVPDRRARTESNADAVLHTLAGRTQVREKKERERERADESL